MSKKRKLSHGHGRHHRSPPHLPSKPSESPPRPKPQAPVIPFSPHHRILLVGEGDFSFAASLARHHACTNITATVPERDAAELASKYPDTAADNAAAVLDASPANSILYGVDACKKGPLAPPGGRGLCKKKKFKPRQPRGELGTAATEFNLAGAGAGDRGEPDGVVGWDRIVFNFPHVGGKSTDVNRQVRHNQSLLVSFFSRAKPALAAGGAVVVTLFEGEPYTLWNVRDLARHCGLRVERSFRFAWAAYPGYQHARTCGVVRSGRKGREGETARGAWRGEERSARSYVFTRKEDEGVVEGVSLVAGKKRKKGRGDSSESDEDEAEEGVEYGVEEEEGVGEEVEEEEEVVVEEEKEEEEKEEEELEGAGFVVVLVGKGQARMKRKTMGSGQG